MPDSLISFKNSFVSLFLSAATPFFTLSFSFTKCIARRSALSENCARIFEAFASRAIRLGANKDDIFEALETATVPEDFKTNHVTKKSYTGYVGSLERLIDQLVEKYPVQIERKSINDGYNYWSWETNSSYNRNGRVWPLNYMLTIKCGDKEEKHSIIVVTNEGGGNYGYDFDRCRMAWSHIKVRLEEIVKKVVEEQ